MSAGPAGKPSAVGLMALFLLFSRLGLSSFGGGVSAWIHRAFVERRGWLGEREFAAALALSRIMPGANVVNLSILIGQRLRGAGGAVAAGAGILVAPGLLVLALAGAWRQLGPVIPPGVLAGASAAAAGLLLGMGIGSGGRLLVKRERSAVASGAVAVATFVSIGVLRWPTVPTVLALGLASIALAFFTGGDTATDEADGER